jgi:hypothetical protein
MPRPKCRYVLRLTVCAGRKDSERAASGQEGTAVNELKLYVTDLGALEDRLQALGGKRTASYWVGNWYLERRPDMSAK